MAENVNINSMGGIIRFVLFFSLAILTLGLATSNFGLGFVGVLIAAPIALGATWLFLSKPKFGVLTFLHVSFFIGGMGRYIPPSIPIGLAVDGILVLTLLGIIFNTKKSDLKKLNNPAFYLSIGWLLYTCLEIINPEAISRSAWFYAVRGVSFYMALAIPAILLLMSEKVDFNQFIKIWLFWSLFSAFWGFRQKYIGLLPGEQAWLDAGEAKTHIVNGELRIFGLVSDAGQYGAAMAHASLVSIILFLGKFPLKTRFFYLITGLATFWGFAISGSRGPLFIYMAGIMGYLLVIKNVRLILVSLFFGAIGFYVLKFTYIGQGTYAIARMRTALDPNDPSLLVRLENQKKLRAYLKNKPFGGGVGSGAYWGQRFTPGTFLAGIEYDSWYVKIWVETGIIGLLIHVLSLLYLAVIGLVKTIKLKDQLIRQKMAAIFAGYFGVLVASYGNQLLGQVPTNTIIYFSIAYLMISKNFDSESENETKAEIQPDNSQL